MAKKQNAVVSSSPSVARVSKHGHLVVATPPKPKPCFVGQRPNPRPTMRVGKDGLYRQFSAQGHMIFVGTIVELLQLPDGGSTLYFAR